MAKKTKKNIIYILVQPQLCSFDQALSSKTYLVTSPTTTYFKLYIQATDFSSYYSYQHSLMCKTVRRISRLAVGIDDKNNSNHEILANKLANPTTETAGSKVIYSLHLCADWI